MPVCRGLIWIQIFGSWPGDVRGWKRLTDQHVKRFLPGLIGCGPGLGFGGRTGPTE